MNLGQVVQSAVNTEKSVTNQENNMYTFFVHPNATKIDVKNAFMEFWGVKVDSVRIIKMPKKHRVAGRRVPQAKRLEKKKAIIKIKPGEKFELLKFAGKKRSKTVKKTTKKTEVKKKETASKKK